MDIMSNKVTRRVALGSIAAGLGGTALVLRALKARYDVAMPSSTGTRKVTVKLNGQDVTIDVPRKIPSTPQEKKELLDQITAQLRKYPFYIEEETRNREKLRDESRKEAIAGFAGVEKRQLADLATKPYPKKEKEAAAKAIKEYVRATKDRALEKIDKSTRDDIVRLSKS